CNFEVNPEYEFAAMEAGFPVVARGANGEVRAIESPSHKFFVATLFQPQLTSTAENPHPVVIAFVQAAADWGRKKLDDSILEEARGEVVVHSNCRSLHFADDSLRESSAAVGMTRVRGMVGMDETCGGMSAGNEWGLESFVRMGVIILRGVAGR